jgi:B12-binding domain/radical SAM domain protein
LTRLPVWFRWNSKNSYSISALMPLIEAKLTAEPKPGIMLYSFATAQASEVYREVSRADVDGVFIAGGPHPSAMPEEALEYFDYVVIGEGEETLPELINVLENSGDPGAVSGIAFLRNGEVVLTDRRPPIDLDRFPPFREILAPLEISRGCPWGCAYCQTPRLCGSKMRHRSVQSIQKYAKYHKDIRFTSPNSLAYGSDGLTPHLDKVESLLRALSECKKPIYFGTFPSEVRPEFVSARALELITSYCKNRVLNIGGQSGSPRVLEAIGRGHTVRHIEEACQLCSDHGITPIVDFIFGLPMECVDDQLQTLELARWIVGRGGKVRAHYFTPLPGTPLSGSTPAPLAGQVAAELGRMALLGNLSGRWMTKATGRTS